MDDLKDLLLEIYNLEKEIENAVTIESQNSKIYRRNSLLYTAVGKVREFGGRAGVIPLPFEKGVVIIFLYLPVKLESGRIEMTKLEWEVQDNPVTSMSVSNITRNKALLHVEL